MHSFFCEFMVNLNIVVSFLHKMAMKRCLEDYGIEKQLKCKNCGVGLCFLGCRAWSLYIHQEDNNKKIYVYWILLYLKLNS
jgi:hypothetical protein